jgi:hypothetical protein
MTSYASLAALTAEHNVVTQARSLKAKPVYFSLEQLQEIAAECIPAQMKATAESYLYQIHGEVIPPSEYLDRVFGLDLVINYRGWLIGLDVTLDPGALAAKQRKQQYLAGAYAKLGLDKWGVIVAPCTDLKATLSQIIKG